MCVHIKSHFRWLWEYSFALNRLVVHLKCTETIMFLKGETNKFTVLGRVRQLWKCQLVSSFPKIQKHKYQFLQE